MECKRSQIGDFDPNCNYDYNHASSSSSSALHSSNIGFQLLKKHGWKQGTGLSVSQQCNSTDYGHGHGGSISSYDRSESSFSMSVSVGYRKRNYDTISSGDQIDVESLTDRVACQLICLEECGAIDSDMLDKACTAYNRFLREDRTLHVKVFLHTKTVADKLKRLEWDLKMYDQMI